MKSLLGNTRKGDITLHRDGRIGISARVSKLMDLRPGDVIDIMADDRNNELYLYIRHHAPVVGRHEGSVFRSNKNGRYLIASSVRLCRYLMRLSNASGAILRLPCGEATTIQPFGIVIPIITRKPLI